MTSEKRKIVHFSKDLGIEAQIMTYFENQNYQPKTVGEILEFTGFDCEELLKAIDTLHFLGYLTLDFSFMGKVSDLEVTPLKVPRNAASEMTKKLAYGS